MVLHLIYHLGFLQPPVVVMPNDEPSLRFTNSDSDEADLFRRFLKLKKNIDTIQAESLSIEMTFSRSYTKRDLDNDLNSFAQEFGINLKKRKKDSLQIVNPFPIYEVKPSKVGGSNEIRFSKNSLLGKGLERLRQQNDLIASDEIQSIQYRLRPWISKSYELCESISGSVFVARKGKKVEVRFLYCDSSD